MELSKLGSVIATVWLLVPSAGWATAPALARACQDINPEVVTRTWAEGNSDCASVCVNGREVIEFRDEAGSEKASNQAEDLAVKLQDLLSDKRINPEELLPGRANDLGAIQCDGDTLLTFDASEVVHQGTDQALNISFKVTNAIRSALGVSTLPPSFLSLARQCGSTANGKKQRGAFSGLASWYGPHFHGRLTSDGHRFDQEKLTAAHRSLPFGTKLLVMNRKTGNTCVVQINDRGPFVGKRVIDLSRGAARQLNMLSAGVASVDCLVLGNQ